MTEKPEDNYMRFTGPKTLRDEFAMAALQVVARQEDEDSLEWLAGPSGRAKAFLLHTAEVAYAIADAMMKAREVKS